jgi:hypothetical protein
MMSRPNIIGPTLPDADLATTLLVLADAALLILSFPLLMAGASVGLTNKKPTTVASRGLLSKLRSASTSTSGGAGNYYQRDVNDDLSNNTEHRLKS